jgi:spore coat protein A
MSNDDNSNTPTGVSLKRRPLLKTGVAAGLLAAVPWSTRVANAVELGSDLTIPKWQTEITGAPPVMASTGKRQGATYYEVGLGKTESQVLPSSLPETTVWGYQGPEQNSPSFPGATIEARRNQRVKVKWENQLPENHLFNVDTRVHGTKPGDYGDFFDDLSQEEFPAVRATTHAHGLHVESASDGLPESWFSRDFEVTGPGFEKDILDYPNRQSAATLWYHDHALGITRLNVYAGLAGFYLLRSSQEDRLDLPDNDGPADYEIPLVIQDRAFENDGELKYPGSFEAEFGGDTAVVNGLAYPYIKVEPRKYRFRLLNGSNTRFYDLELRNDTGNQTPADDVPLLYQIGVELGFLPETVPIGPGGELNSLVLAPAERADVVVDFSDHEGDTLTMTNDAEFPYAGGNDPSVSPNEIMQFRVTKELQGEDAAADPMSLNLPSGSEFPEQSAKTTRNHTLDTGSLNGLDTHFLNEAQWDDEDAIEEVQVGTTEIWRLANTTGDTHPIHLHLVEFQLLDTQEFDAEGFNDARDNGETPAVEDYLEGDPQPPDPNELGDKDTVRVDPDEAVRIIARFGEFTGRYVWHCHILEHEDQEMMLPFRVVEGNSG